MAKIEVTCSAEGFKLSKVKLHRYNTSGYCAPTGVDEDTATDWKYEENAVCNHVTHIPENSVSTSELNFVIPTENGFIAYVPEFDNKTNTEERSYIEVTLQHTDGSSVTLNSDPYIYFCEYNTETGEPIENASDFDIVRNHWYKYNITNVDDGELIFQYRVMKWNVESSTIGWNVQFKIAAYNSNDGIRLEPDYEDATVGDDEATYCYVLYPRYHGTAHNEFDYPDDDGRSSYAAFSFQLTEPKGAVWKAYLREPNNGPYDTPNFAFGTGQYDIDGDDKYDLFNVSTGIAREEPYQIQIKALNAWTDTDIDNPQNTTWGNLVEYNSREIYVDLYITVSLDGEEEYELEINPEHVVSTTYWNDGRRFAGDDKYIRIWQLKATKGEGYETLIQESGWSIYSTYWNRN